MLSSRGVHHVLGQVRYKSSKAKARNMGANTTPFTTSPDQTRATYQYDSATSFLQSDENFLGKDSAKGRRGGGPDAEGVMPDSGRLFFGTGKEFAAMKPPKDSDVADRVPGDSFGILQSRVPFYAPVQRDYSSTHANAENPTQNIAEELVLQISAITGVHVSVAQDALLRHGLNTNDALRWISLGCPQTEEEQAAAMEAESKVARGQDVDKRRFKFVELPRLPYSIVAYESYDPESFALVNYAIKDYDTLYNDDVLDVLHEITMSAAEMPLDTPRNEMVSRLVSDWTIEGGEKVSTLMKETGVGIRDVIILPFGEYAVQGAHVLHKIDPGRPNMGVAACCVNLDLRNGIHTRFRDEMERVCDSIAEHVVKETMHFKQNVPILRQPYWWNPAFSVEDYLRFKETILQPSALMFELRYAYMGGLMGTSGYRNLVEMEKLREAQRQYGSDITEAPWGHKGMNFSGEGGMPISVTAGYSSTTHGGINEGEGQNKYDDVVRGQRWHFGTEGTGILDHRDRIWRRYYKDRHH